MSSAAVVIALHIYTDKCHYKNEEGGEGKVPVKYNVCISIDWPRYDFSTSPIYFWVYRFVCLTVLQNLTEPHVLGQQAYNTAD